jgi:cyclopropane-fatty-acyl-phospholipid synthase
MTTTIIPRTLTPAPTRRARPLSRLLRAAVLGRLETVRDVKIVVREGHDVTTIGGEGPEIGIAVHDPRFYRAIALGGSLGAADAWIQGWWSCTDLTGLLRAFARSTDDGDRVEGGVARLTAPLQRAAHALRRNSPIGSRRNILAHYDLGNPFFETFLDETMTYSCGIFAEETTTLAEASVAKLDRLCRKLGLEPHHHVVEIGTGWGSFALHAARTYGCRVTTTTISAAQYDEARRRVRESGLEERIDVRREDYRDLRGSFDRLVSIEMIEAVGHRYLGTFFRQCADLLKPDGLMALQAITMPDQRYAQYRRSVDFIRSHVFPGSCVPSVQAMVDAIAGSSDLRLTNLEDIGPHYATTLAQWRERFMTRIDDVRELGYPETLVRLWLFYLCYCEAGFAERYLGTVQMLLAKPGCRRRSARPEREGAVPA